MASFKRLLKAVAGILLSGMLLCACSSGSEADSGVEPVALEDMIYICHSLGSVYGHKYMNCPQVAYGQYEDGYRYFEVDLDRTSDGHMILVHDCLRNRRGPKAISLRHIIVASTPLLRRA